MRLKILLIIVAICMLGAVVSVRAETYYISKTGDDNASGTSWAQAWATLEKVNSSISAGDTVLFGTGRWYNSQIRPPYGSTAFNRTVYACSTFVDGGDGSDSWHLASICGGDSVTNWTAYDLTNGRNIWQAPWSGSGCWSGAAGNDGGTRSFTLTQNDELLKCVLNVSDISAEGQWTHIESSNRIYAWVKYGQNPNNLEMLSSCKPPLLFDNDQQDYIHVYGLDLRMGKQGTVLFAFGGSVEGVLIEHCNISRVGHDFGENPAVIMSRAKNYDGGIHRFVRNTVIRACSVGVARGTAASYYEHAGTGIEMYCAKNITIDSCWIHDVDGDGIMWKNQNLMNNDSLATGNVVRFTTFENIGEFGFVGGNNSYRDSVYGCTFINCGEAGMDPNHGSDIDYGRHFFANNTFYRCNMFFWSRYGQVSDDSTSEFKYNIMYDHESDYTFDYFNNWVRMSANQNGYEIDYNIWYDPSTSFNGYCSSGSSWNSWQQCGFDSHGAVTDPGFANPGAGNFSRPSSSDEINVTYGGRTWTRIGAWQPDSGTPPDTGQSGDNIARGITPTVSGTFDGYSVTALTDGITDPTGNPSTTWASDQSTSPHWIVIDFGQEKTVESIRLFWAWNSFGSSWTNSQRFQVQRWTGSAYVDITDVNENDTLSFVTTEDTVTAHPGNAVTYTSGDSCVTIIGFPAVTTSRIRIYQPANMGSVGYPTILWMSELEIYSKDIVPPAIESPDLGALPGDRNGQIELFWKAPGDDGLSGQARQYVIKYDTKKFTAADWRDLPSFFNPPIPQQAGNQERMIISWLTPGQTYYVALKAYDEAGNASPMTNVAEVTAFMSQIAQSEEDTLEIESPKQGAALHTSHPILTVRNYDDSDTNRYVFEIARNDAFSDFVTVSSPVVQEPWETTSWQVPQALRSDLTYYWRARVNNAYVSATRYFTVIPEAHAYPNPFNRQVNEKVTFTELPQDGSIVLMTVSGTTVKYLSNNNGGDIAWDGTNQDGEPVASGTYLWFVEGTDIGGKLVVTY